MSSRETEKPIFIIIRINSTGNKIGDTVSFKALHFCRIRPYVQWSRGSLKQWGVEPRDYNSKLAQLHLRRRDTLNQRWREWYVRWRKLRKIISIQSFKLKINFNLDKMRLALRIIGCNNIRPNEPTENSFKTDLVSLGCYLFTSREQQSKQERTKWIWRCKFNDFVESHVNKFCTNSKMLDNTNLIYMQMF